ncbi:MAG: hypothetical protein CM15mP59_2670 [Flavobacteriaceae bacterium]|nr:MAG: hypothetical protein CM15mP59_2670 [Flavobacteriaceae bacterium]
MLSRSSWKSDLLHILFDEGKFREINKKMSSKDPLNFEDSKKYKDRLSSAQKNKS